MKLFEVRICSSRDFSFHLWFFIPGSIPFMLRRIHDGGVTVCCLFGGLGDGEGTCFLDGSPLLESGSWGVHNSFGSLVVPSCSG